MKHGSLTFSTLTLLAALLASPALAQDSFLPDVKELDGDPVHTLLPPDRIRAIDRPVFVPAAEAAFMKKNEMVIGFVLNGVAKAYSVWHLDSHEIVNDEVGGAAVAVTW